MAPISMTVVRRDFNSRLAFIAFFGSMASMGYGFDQGWLSGSFSRPEFNKAYGICDATGTCALDASQLSYGTGVSTAAVILGLFAGSPINERWGRRWTILLLSIIAIIGIVIEVTAWTSYAQLTVGRVVVYFAGGIASNVVPIYQAECAPPSLRGAMTACYNVALIIGATVSAIVVYLCRDIQSDYAFRIVLILQFVSPLILIGAWFFLPESPRWLVKKGRTEEAISVIRDMRKGDYDAEEEVRLLQLQLAEEKQLHAAVSYLDCFRGTNLRRTIVATGPQVCQQAQGIAFMANYLAVFLVGLGFDNILELLVILYSVGVLANIFSIFTNDTVGRRNGLLYGAVIMAISMLTVGGLTAGGIGDLSHSRQSAVTAMLVIWFFVFQLTWGPLAWVISGEIPTAQVREKTVTISAFGSFGTGLPITFCNPYVQNNIGTNVIFIYGGFSILTIIFVYFIIPETKGRSLEELDEMFNAKVSARKFGSYVCTGLGAEIEQVEKRGSIVSYAERRGSAVQQVEA